MVPAGSSPPRASASNYNAASADLLQRPSEEMSDLIITVHPEIMQRLKTEDADHLISLERRYHGRLTFRSEPTQPREKVTFISAETGRELR